MMRFAALALALILAATGGAVAEESLVRFDVRGEVLVFDTTASDTDIVRDDAPALLATLRANPAVTTLSLNSEGGSIFAAYRMADIVIDFGLDTVVDGQCDSACMIVFMGGAERRMTRGSRVGFHERNWSADGIERYYDRWREDEGWATIFDFIADIYIETQQEAYEDARFLVDRGVDARFALETIRDRGDDVWRPRRSELLDAGVLTQ